MKFVLVGNRMGKVRLCRFFNSENLKARTMKQHDIIRLCLKDQKQEGFVEYQDTMLVYRLYTNLIFIAGTSLTENELAVMEVLQNFVETVIKYFEQVSEEDWTINNPDTFVSGRNRPDYEFSGLPKLDTNNVKEICSRTFCPDCEFSGLTASGLSRVHCTLVYKSRFSENDIPYTRSVPLFQKKFNGDLALGFRQ